MTTKDKIKLLTNHSTQNNNINGVITINYLLMIDENLELERKRLRRELAIDITLGEKDESEWNKETLEHFNQPFDGGEYPAVITPKIYTMSLKDKKFNSYEDVLDEIIDLLETSSNKPTKSGRNVVLKNEDFLTDKDNFEANCRRILTMINLHSNLIAINGRIGQGNVILTHPDNSPYLEYLSDLNVIKNFILSDKITKNKIIIGRSNDNNTSPGLYFVDNSNYGKYYLDKTKEWDKQYSWFWIK